MEKYRMHGFVKTPFCRVMAQILVFLMVMQGMPLWELSRSYEWVPDKFCRVINHVVVFLGPGQAESATVVFGPKQYHRTEGEPNIYTDSFAGVLAEGNLVVQNGDQDGNYRISSAIIRVNGVQVFDPNDFNQQVGYLETPVSLGEENSISLELRGEPEGHLTIKITGESQNSPPVADAGPDQTAFITDTVQLDGSASSDVDGDGLTYEWSFVSVPAGSAASLSDAAVMDSTFILDLPGSYVVQLIVNDGLVDSVPDTVTISTDNSVPVANAGPDQTVFVDDTVILDSSGSTDVDGDLLALTWSFVFVPDGSTASLSDPSSVEPTFVVDMAGTYVIQLIVNDGFANSDPDTVTISTENRKPVANAGPDQTVFIGDMVTLDGGGSSDVDGDLLTFMWSFASIPEGSATAMSDPTAVNPTFDVDEPGAYVVQLIVNDGILDSDPDTVTISTENRKPVADAGPDQTVFVGDMATLDGSGSSDVDGDLLTFMWSFTSMPAGSTAILSDPTAVAPSFDIDQPGIYVVQVIVNDGMLDSDPDTVTISTENRKPVADAGPDQTVFVTETVTLDGCSSSDVDGDPLTYQWSFTSIPSGSAATLSDPVAVNPTFIVDMTGTYTVQLIVNDGLLDSDPDIVTITTENSPPVANAGPDQTVFVTETVQIDGSTSSDVDGDPLTYQWSFTSIPAGSTATLSDPTLVNPTFVIDLPGTYTVQLIVNDGTVDSVSDSLIISTGNSRPVAEAGPDQTVFLTETVQLDGSGSSDVDGNALTYEWSFVSVPAGSTASLSDSTLVNPSFVVDLPGTYVAQLIVNDGMVDSNPDTVTISTQNSPPVADTGLDQTAFVGDTVTLDGSSSSDVDGDLLTFNWSLISVPEGSTAILSDPTAVNPTFVIDEPGTYVMQLIVNDGTVDSDPDSVTITTTNSPPVADAGPAQTVFVTETVQLDGSGSNDADGDSLTFVWSFTSRPVGSTATLSDSTIVNPTFVADLPGTYTIQLIVNDGTVDSDPDAVVISTQNSRPVASAGSDQTVSIGDTVTLDGSGSSDVDGDPLTYQWSFMSIPAGSGATLSDPAAIDPTFEADLPGTYVVQLIINDGTVDSDPDTVTISTENFLPVANAGPDQTVNEDDTAQLGGGLSSDPDGDPLTYSWSFTSVPSGSTATLSNPAIADPTFVADLAGAYVVQLIVNDGTVDSDPDTVNITAVPVNSPPAITSAPVTTATEGEPYSHDVDAIDPDVGDILTFSLDASPAGMTIDSTTGLIQWTPTSGQVGDNDITVRVEDIEGLFDTQSFAVTVSGVTPGPDHIRPEVTVTILPTEADVGDSVTITVNAVDNVGVVSQELLVNGVSVPLDPSGTATYSSSVPGVFTAETTALDAAGNEGLDSKEFRFLTPGDTIPPTVVISSPADEAKLSVPTDIIGTADDDTNLTSYKLEYSVKGKNEFITFASGTSPVTDDVLGSLDPTMMRNGLYDVKLTAEDASGNTASIIRTYQLEGEMKVGNFTISFNDLTIPVVGIPITVTRTYDSRVKSKGDFGSGWTLDLKTVEVQENRVPGDGWEVYCTRSIFGTCVEWGVRPTNTHSVVVTFPDGRDHEFDVQAVTTYADLSGLAQGHLTFTAQPGTFSTLEALDNTTYDFLMGGELLDMGFNIINPNRYRLTDVDGTVFVCNQSTGLEQITDPNGNIITFSADGITHSAGKSVTFTRDAQGRITTITDPMGNTIQYAYDFYGDLVGVTDQEGNTSRFTYNSSHGLVDIIDPRGIRPARNEYDDEGRLVAHIDAEGNRIEYTHNVGARQEVVKDRLGNVTVYEYDDDGNVISQTDALGNTTSYTYDDRSNKLSETDPVGNTTAYTYDTRDNLLTKTDPLGKATTYSYNSRNQVLITTDPNGNTITNTYDARGNLLTSTDPLGNTTTNVYDASGNLLSTTDCLGNVTTYEYDTYGNLIKEIDALGNETTYTYDANGNQLNQTTTRTTPSGVETITTTKTYNGVNRPVQMIDPYSNTTSIEYNCIGKKSAEIDKLGNRVEYEYDARGNLVHVIYPDSTEERYTYGAENRKLTFTDRTGRTTSYTYDNLCMLIRTTFPDGTFTQAEYDAAGRIVRGIDECGNPTRYTYDAAGQRTSVIDALSNTTSYEYDNNGNMIRITDANGNIIQYEYDANNQRIRTIFSDGTSSSTAYNAMGRKISEADQAGKITQFEYDALGRLVKVTDALGSTTSYAYDEVGNRISQTDANGNTISLEYDKLGRCTKRILPLGMEEVSTYDAAGNIVSQTDFNRDTITFEYDVSNRLVRKNFPDGISEIYTYTATGQRQTMTDIRGVTSYEYDLRDRLVRRIDPDDRTISYTYDAAGNRISVAIPAGTTNYAFDALNRLVTVTAPDGGVTTYTYDAVGNRASITYPNGAVAEYTYDSLNRLTNLVNRKASSEIISSYIYTLGPAGNRIGVVENTGRTVDYTYDGTYKLTQESINDPVSGSGLINYTYDHAGNRLTKTDDGLTTTYTYNANDRLLTENGATYTYDDNGNTLTKVSATENVIYSYDFQNQLIRANITDTSGSSLVEYAYDVDGIRVQKTVDGADVTNYLVDKNRQFAQVLVETDALTAPIVSYVYGDDLISQKRGVSTSYYHYDGQMSTRQLTDTTETATDTYTYDAFGKLLSSSGVTLNNYLYTGEQLDPNIAFYYLRARYNNPNTGRFLTQDPFPGDIFDPPSLHRYLYANADPVNNLDPSGRFTVIGVMMSISINTNLQLIYITNVLKIFISSMKIAFCVIEPATQMRSIALMAIGNGAGPWAYELESTSRGLIAQGYAMIGKAIADGYIAMGRGMLPQIKVELFTDLDILINGYSLRGMIDEVQKLQEFKSKAEEYLGTALDLLFNVNNSCSFWTAMEEHGDTLLGLIPKF